MAGPQSLRPLGRILPTWPDNFSAEGKTYYTVSFISCTEKFTSERRQDRWLMVRERIMKKQGIEISLPFVILVFSIVGVLALGITIVAKKVEDNAKV